MNTIKVERDPLALDDECFEDDVAPLVACDTQPFVILTNQQFRDKLFCCQVCNMLQVGFSNYTEEEKMVIIEKGRPKPNLTNLVHTTPKGQPRNFNPKKYDKCEWLTGCEKRGRLFCWPCLLFSTKDDAWMTIGISDISNLPYVLKKHSTSRHHIESMVNLRTFGKKFCDIDSDGDEECLKAIENMKRLKQEEVTKNRSVLKKLIHVACFLGMNEFGPPGVGGGDPSDPIDQNKYEYFIDFISKYDYLLAKQLGDNKYFLSSRIRNNLISSIYNVVTKEIVEEISHSSFVSMILDEVAEMGDTTLVSTIVRYVDSKGVLQERFLNFREIPLDRQANSLLQVINENVKLCHCSSKFVSLSCDGGIVSTTELYKLQNKVKIICPNILFLHYYKHKVNSVLAQSLSTIKQCKQFFFILNSLAMNFLKSPKLSDQLNFLIRKTKPKAKDFRWNFNGMFINEVRGIRQPLIDLFEQIVVSEDGWDAETVFASSRFLYTLSSDLSFNMLLIVLGDVFPGADDLANTLLQQAENIDLCVLSVKRYINYINKNFRDNTFNNVYVETLRLTGNSEEPPIKMIKLENGSTNDSKLICKTLYDNVLSNILMQLHSRFTDLEKITFLPLADFRKFQKLPVDSMLTTLSNYIGHKFDVTMLKSELSVLFETGALLKSDVKDTLNYLRLKNMDTILPETMKLCELSLALPHTPGNSIIDRVQNYILMSTPTQRLSPLAILYIEKEMIENCSQKAPFFSDIMKDFSKSEQAIPLLYDN